MEEKFLPPRWPKFCREPGKLPFCPDYRTHKSSSSNNSGETPSHPKYHRSFSGKHGTPTSDVAASIGLGCSNIDGQRRYRSMSACVTSMDRQSSFQKKKLIVKQESQPPKSQCRANSSASNKTRAQNRYSTNGGEEEPDFHGKSADHTVNVNSFDAVSYTHLTLPTKA